jgi:hypothetical protein
MWDHLAQVRGVTITIMITQHVWVVVGPHHGWKGPTYGCGDQGVCLLLSTGLEQGCAAFNL